MFQCLFARVKQHGIKGMETIRLVLIMKPTFFFFFSLIRNSESTWQFADLERSQSMLKSISLTIWPAFLGNIPLEFLKLHYLTKAEKFISSFSLYELTWWMQFPLWKLMFERSRTWSFFPFASILYFSLCSFDSPLCLLVGLKALT